MAMRALQEAQRAERRKIINDDFLPVGWRDVCLPINRAQLGFMHGSTPTTTTITGTTDEGASPVSSPSKSGAGGQGRGREEQAEGQGPGEAVAVQCGVHRLRSRPRRCTEQPACGARQTAATMPACGGEGPGEEDEGRHRQGRRRRRSDGDGDGDGGGGTGAKEEQTPAVWGLLNTLTLGALGITPLAGEVLSSAAALVESAAWARARVRARARGVMRRRRRCPRTSTTVTTRGRDPWAR